MKRWRFIPLLLLILLLSPRALAAAPPSGFDPALVENSPSMQAMEVQSAAAILVDDSYGKILYEQNAHTQRYPASITKIMTCLLAIEAVERGTLSLEQTVTAGKDLYTGIGSGGSTQNIKAGEQLTIQDLLYCALIPSANEACNVLAGAVAGDIPSFVEQMNQKAQALGMSDTHFANTHGYHDDNHYTTAYDIYLLAREALRHSIFREIVSSPSYTVPATNLHAGRTLKNTNALLVSNKPEYYCPDAIGIKTGSTPEAGYCLTSAAARDGRTLIAVVLGAARVRQPDGSTDYQQFSESRRLLEWGLDHFGMSTLASPEENIGTIEVSLSKETQQLDLRPTSSLAAFLPDDLDPSALEYTWDCPDSVEAPVDAGQVLGTLTISCGTVTYGTLELAAVGSATRSLSLFLQDRAAFFFAHPLGKAAVFAAAALLLLLLKKRLFPKRKKAASRR